MTDKVRIRAMGAFVIDVNGNPCENLPVRSRKGVTLLLYLIMEKGRLVSSQRLIREMWSGKRSESPESALKTLVSRTRAMLNELSPGLGACIASATGGYRWEKPDNVTVDVLEIMEIFEKLREDCTREDRAALTDQMMALYRGDLYSTGEVSGDVISVNHLHREYLDAVLKYVAQLREEESYNRLCEVCRQAMQIDDMDEQLHIELMQGMAKLNRADEALREYRSLAKTTMEEYGEEPSEELRACYDRIAREGSTLQYNLDVIRNELDETASDRRGPFFCDYQSFKEIYNIEMRNLGRMGSAIFLGMIMLGEPGDEINPISRESCMAGLHEIMRINLRKGDIITRFADNTYAMLLPTANYATCSLVIERLEGLFYEEYPSRSITFHARISPMGG